MYEAAFSLEPYRDESSSCAVAAITPEHDAFMHTYYDICPWSPSGRYVVCLRLPFEERRPNSTDKAEVCLVDLEQRSIRGLYKTTAWGFQTGAHQMWGNDDDTLYFNVRRDGRAVGVRYHIDSDKFDLFEGPIWQVAPGERMAVSPCLNRANLTQPEYGIAVPQDKQEFNTERASETDGLFVVDLQSGTQRLLLSLSQVWEAIPDHSGIEDAILYGFHAKINGDGSHVVFVVRARKPDGSYVPMLATSRADGSDLRITVPHDVWQKGGHHPSWHPNGYSTTQTARARPRARRVSPYRGRAGALRGRAAPNPISP
jgi:hypothetical protein